MRRLWLCVLLVACGGGGDDTDGGGVDATADVVKDTTASDVKADVLAEAGADAPDDVTVDAPDDVADAPDDVNADVILVDGGICGLCPQNTVCCTIPNAIYYGKCYSPKCLACCQ